MSTDFVYKPLGTGEIRLVELVPAARVESEIACRLRHVPPDSKPEYTAISYAWGDIAEKCPIVIDNATSSIGKAAGEVLHQMQRDFPDRLFWIDQLCINQNDADEKSSQVQQMRSIYSQAAEVFVWLGGNPERFNSLLLFRRLHEFNSRHNTFGAALQVSDGEFDAPLHSNEAEKDQVIQAWHRLCGLDYWKRIWVVQEYAAAKRLFIVWGRSRVASEVFTEWVNFLVNYETIMGLYKNPLDPDVLVYNTPSSLLVDGIATQRTGSDSAFLDVLKRILIGRFSGTHRFCTDPRDRIFSLIHLAKDAEKYIDLIDYNIPTKAIYEEAAVRILESQGLQLLNLCEFPKNIPDLPSWVPDWSMFLQVHHEVSRRHVFEVKMGRWKQDLRLLEPGKLSALGFILDSVERVGDIWRADRTAPVDSSAVLDYLRQVRAFCRDSGTVAEDEEAAAAARIAVAHSYKFNFSMKVQDEEYARLYDGVTKCLESLKPTKLEDVTQLSTSEGAYVRTMQQVPAKRPFVGSFGPVGLCPWNTEPGDLICCLFGLYDPIVIRERPDRNFSLIGPAFVDRYVYNDSVIEEEEAVEINLV